MSQSPSLLALVASISVVTVITGCKSPEPAPADLDGLGRFFLTRFDPAETDRAVTDTELQDAFAKLHDTLDGDNIVEAQSGLLAALTLEDLTALGLPNLDPSFIQGMFITTIIHCGIDALEAILLEPDQLSLYPEAYESYDRVLDADRPDYFPTWKTAYRSAELPIISNQYTANTHGGLRESAIEGSRFEKTLLQRVVLPEPAVFDSEGSEFVADFQVESYHERAPGEVIHFYAMWRDMTFGVLGDSKSGFVIDQTLSGMLDWDAETDELCAR